MTGEELLNLPVSIDHIDIINDVINRKERCRDQQQMAYQLRRSREASASSGYLTFSIHNMGEDDYVHLTPHAESMLLTRMRIPGGYFHRCPTEMQIDQINYWLQQSRQTLCLRIKGDKHVRAIFGKRFKASLDDHRVIPVFVDAMDKQQSQEHGSLIYSGYQVDDKITSLSTIMSNLRAEHEGVLSRAGVVLVNSEVGASALHIRPIVHNKRYYKWIDFYAGIGGTTSLRHTQELKEGQMDAAVQKALQAAQQGVQRLYETMHEEVQHPINDLKKIIDSSSVLSARVMDGLLEDYETKQLTVKYQIAEDIILACKDLPLFKQHVAKIEVGRYLNLFGADEARMDDILDD